MIDPGYNVDVTGKRNSALQPLHVDDGDDEPVAVADPYGVAQHDSRHSYSPRVRLWRVLAGIMAAIYVMPGLFFTLGMPMAIMVFDSGESLGTVIAFFSLVTLGPCLLVSAFVLGRFAVSGPPIAALLSCLWRQAGDGRMESLTALIMMALLPLIPVAALLIAASLIPENP